MKIVLSVIYVYYNTPNEIINSVKTLTQSLGKISYEIIIIDNASAKEIPAELTEKTNIKILKNKNNYGYGKGLNQGAKFAKGEYLLLINPDVEFDKNSVTKLLSKIESDTKIGVVGPQSIDKNGKILQSISGAPTLSQGLFAFSFLGKIWPGNPFSKKYHNLALDRNKSQKVDVVSGACMMVRKSAFDNIGGFDERFFMYFEEADFCVRIKKAGYDVLYVPEAIVVHLVGKSTQDKKWIAKTFKQSRFKYFRKYYGLIPAILEELLLRILEPSNVLLLFTVALSAFLNFFRLNDRMIFMGDQGWFYLSARDMLIAGQIPLVGIASSHPWLHQGPLWTYILALALWIFRFNPISGGYFTAFLTTVTVFFVYKFGEEIFSKKIGLISALLYASSPLVIISAQMPYHTNLIPLLTLGLIYSVYRWIRGSVSFFPIIILLMALLYNFELATQVLWFAIGIIFVAGIVRKEKWARVIFKMKNLFISLILFIIPMLPVIIYDINHGFAQTAKFFAWMPYRIVAQLFGAKNGFLSASSNTSLVSMFSFLKDSYRNLIFIDNIQVPMLIIFLSLGYLIYFLATNKSRSLFLPINILLIFIVIPAIGIFINMTPSGAYLPMLFPSIIIFTGWIFGMIGKRYLFFPVAALVLLVAVGNISFYLDNSKVKQVYGLYFSQRLGTVRNLIEDANGENYNMKGKGLGSQFNSFTMNYEYLAWWLGHSPAKSPQKLIYTIQESKSGIILSKNE